MARSTGIIKRLPAFYQSEERFNNLYRLIEAFGILLDGTETDLVKVLHSHWVDTANNEDSLGFNTAQKGDLDKIFSLYLENLGSTSLLKQSGRREGEEGKLDDDRYRQRIKGLIGVLLNGASTKKGIISIVAANLGIVGESTQAINARKKIRIVEFNPEFIGTANLTLKPFQNFALENPSPVPRGIEVKIKVRDDFPLDVVQMRFVRTNGDLFGYTGTLSPGEELSILRDGTLRKNGQIIPEELDGIIPVLPPGITQWQAQIFLRVPEGRFDDPLPYPRKFDFSAFDKNIRSQPGMFDVFDVLEFSVTQLRQTPGRFSVVIPWDIEGYTELLDESPDKPRSQIKYIVNKVKAAGVFADIVFEKRFTLEEGRHEDQGLEDSLAGVAFQGIEDAELAELPDVPAVASIQQPDAENQDLQETFKLSGVFDYTGFDTLNGFG